jgi:hypothetical protein
LPAAFVIAIAKKISKKLRIFFKSIFNNVGGKKICFLLF